MNKVVEEWVHQDLLAAKETREALDHQVRHYIICSKVSTPLDNTLFLIVL